jgi:hypothetical protein
VIVESPTVCAPDDTLIVDMRVWHLQPEVNPAGFGWSPPTASRRYPAIEHVEGCGDPPQGACLGRDALTSAVLDGSGTSVAVLNALPYGMRTDPEQPEGFEAASNEWVLETRALLEASHPGRSRCALAVMPNDRLELQLERMQLLAPQAAAWVLTTTWSTTGVDGFALDDPASQRVIQRGLDLERPIFFVPKGLPSLYAAGTRTATAPDDVARVARVFPSAHFVVQGSAFEHGMSADETSAPEWDDPGADQGWGPGVGRWPEGPYDEESADVQALYPLARGVNSLIRALRAENIGPGGRDLDDPDGPVKTHVYAECSGVWPALAAGREQEAMHYWGKLLKHVGEDRILWGTGALFYGTPQPLIDAFLALEISDELQDRHGYPQLTAAIKRKVLGQSAAHLFSILADVDIPGCHADATAALTRRQLLRLA